MKNHFHIKGWALNLILIQRPGGTRKWPIVLPPRPPPPNNIYTPTMDTLCARDFSCTLSSFSLVFIVTHAKSFFLWIAACDFSLQPKNLSAWSWHARKNLWYPGQSWRNYSIEIPAPTPTTPPSPLWRFHIGWCSPQTIGSLSKDVLERHMLTGSEAFPLTVPSGATKCLLLQGSH